MARAQKLKVFRTAIGFHDAYVAAPSRKAALAAWGSDADLFARGMAEQVTDEALEREPLAHPGKVIRRLRGTAEEQLAALPPDAPGTGTAPDRKAGREPAMPASDPKPKPKPIPRPSREKLDAMETELAGLLKRQRAERDELRKRQQAIDRERAVLDQAQERERAAAERALAREQEAHAARMDRWRKDG